MACAAAIDMEQLAKRQYDGLVDLLTAQAKSERRVARDVAQENVRRIGYPIVQRCGRCGAMLSSTPAARWAGGWRSGGSPARHISIWTGAPRSWTPRAPRSRTSASSW